MNWMGSYPFYMDYWKMTAKHNKNCDFYIFTDQVQEEHKEENIYFVRINPHGFNTSKNEIDLFIDSIKRINPNIKFNFLLIDTVQNDCDVNYITIDIDNVIFHHKYFYEKDVNDVYMQSSIVIHETYKKILEEHYTNKKDHTILIWRLLSLMIWLKNKEFFI